LKSFDGLSLLFSLDVLFLIVGFLDFAPALLDGEGLLFVFEGELSYDINVVRYGLQGIGWHLG